MTTSTRPWQLHDHWASALAPGDAQAILAFWRDEGAITDPRVAIGRLGEVVSQARDRDGRVIGICTAYAALAERLGQPMYHYRCCVGAAWRSSALVLDLFRRAHAVLERYAQAHDFPCIGLLAALENPLFTQGELRLAPVWPRLGLTYVGTNAQGQHLRVSYFRGARLKTA